MNSNLGGLYRVTFLDKDGQEIDCYNPRYLEREGAIHAIEDK
jgi:hypothetical protein